MKKLSLLCAVLFALSFTACKKDYTCTCSTFLGDVATPIENVSKSEAKDTCSEAETALQEAGDTTATCTLD